MYCIHCGKQIKDDNIPCYYCGKKQKIDNTKEIDIKVIKIYDNEKLFEKTIKEFVENGYEIKASNCIQITDNIKNMKLTPIKYTYYALLQKNRDV